MLINAQPVIQPDRAIALPVNSLLALVSVESGKMATINNCKVVNN